MVAPSGPSGPIPLKDQDNNWDVERCLPDGYHCYDIEVVCAAGMSLQPLEVDQIVERFKELVGMRDNVSGCIKVNNRTFLSPASRADWLQSFFVTLSTALASVSPYGDPSRGRKAISRSAQPTLAIKGGGASKVEEPITFSEPLKSRRLVRLCDRSTSESDILGNQSLKKDMIASDLKSLGEKSGDKAPTAMVFAREVKFSLNDRRTMDCWALQKEASAIHEFETALATAHVHKWFKLECDVSKPSTIGDRVFGPPKDLDCGVQEREGWKLRWLLADKQNAKIHGTECSQFFLKPVLVSDFIVQFLGGKTNFVGIDQKALDRLNKALKGVKVQCAYSNRRHAQAIQAVDGRTADLISVNVPGQVPDTITLTQLFSDKGQPLRYPYMPCFNFGTEARPYWQPAEACKIVPGQTFNHNVPLTADDTVFSNLTDKDTPPKVKSPSPWMAGNSFDEIDTTGFALCFVEVVVVDGPPCLDQRFDAVTRHCTKSDNSWERFQHEIGQRFGKQLESAVKKSSRFVLPYYPGQDTAGAWKKLLASPMAVGSGIKNVLIACIPGGEHNHDIHDTLRELCDSTFGVQCNIVTAKEVIKRAKSEGGPASKELEMFTGAIVRRIFARACIPGKVHSEYRKSDQFIGHYGAEADVPKSGLLVAIHVHPLQGVVDADGLSKKSADYHLVTITSFSEDLSDDQVRTTHDLISLSNHTLANRIQSCVIKHVNTCNSTVRDATQIVFYRSGTGSQDRLQMCAEVENLTWISNFKKEPDTAFLTYVNQPTTIVADNSAPIEQNELDCVVGLRKGAYARTGPANTELFFWGGGRVSSTDEAGASGDVSRLTDLTDKGVSDTLADPFRLNRALQQIYVRPQTEVQDSKKTYLVTHCHMLKLEPQDRAKTFEELRNARALTKLPIQVNSHKVSAFGHQIDSSSKTSTKPDDMWFCVFRSIMKKATMPDILFLAQTASNRALKYVKLGEGKDVNRNVIPFTMPNIAESLEHALYFL